MKTDERTDNDTSTSFYNLSLRGRLDLRVRVQGFTELPLPSSSSGLSS